MNDPGPNWPLIGTILLSLFLWLGILSLVLF
jgi:hypothetical protein